MSGGKAGIFLCSIEKCAFCFASSGKTPLKWKLKILQASLSPCSNDFYCQKPRSLVCISSNIRFSAEEDMQWTTFVFSGTFREFIWDLSPNHSSASFLGNMKYKVAEGKRWEYYPVSSYWEMDKMTYSCSRTKARGKPLWVSCSHFISSPMIELSQIHLWSGRLVSAPFADFLSKDFSPPCDSASDWFIKIYRNKRETKLSSWKLLCGERPLPPPMIQDPNSEKVHSWFSAWYQWEFYSSFTHSYTASKSASLSLLSAKPCELWCPNKHSRTACQ